MQVRMLRLRWWPRADRLLRVVRLSGEPAPRGGIPIARRGSVPLSHWSPLRRFLLGAPVVVSMGRACIHADFVGDERDQGGRLADKVTRVTRLEFGGEPLAYVFPCHVRVV